MYVFHLFCLTLFTLASIEQPFIRLIGGHAGVFSIFEDVLGTAKEYEKGGISGFEVDFRKAGHYYDSSHGPNWWQYYCEPLSVGTPEYVVEIDRDRPHGDANLNFPYKIDRVCDNRDEACYLINKYFRLKPHVRDKIDHFYEQNFRDAYIIGIHYRGTDKEREAPRVNYKHVYYTMMKIAQDHPHRRIKLFIATDEQQFLTYIKKKSPYEVCYVPGMLRSLNTTTPVHVHSPHPYKAGEDAIVDCYLLSKCHYLIRCKSNLSHWSTLLNPQLPVYLMN